jgi:hypothetical protein
MRKEAAARAGDEGRAGFIYAFFGERTMSGAMKIPYQNSCSDFSKSGGAKQPILLKKMEQ